MLSNKLSSLVAQAFIFLIQLLRPLLGPENICPFSVGCTQYAILQLQSQPLYYAIYTIIKRLLNCNPITNFLKKS